MCLVLVVDFEIVFGDCDVTFMAMHLLARGIQILKQIYFRKETVHMDKEPCGVD